MAKTALDEALIACKDAECVLEPRRHPYQPTADLPSAQYFVARATATGACAAMAGTLPGLTRVLRAQLARKEPA